MIFAGRNNFVDGVNKTSVEVGKLLIGLNETLRGKVVGAAATVGEMHALLTPKCRGELQVRQAGFFSLFGYILFCSFMPCSVPIVLLIIHRRVAEHCLTMKNVLNINW